MPAALGAQIGSGLRPLVMCGDGGFQMTGPEISQAPAKGVNPIVVRDQQRRMGHLPADCRAPRAARDSAVAVRATRARLGRRRIRGDHRRAVARRAPSGPRLQIVRDHRRARRTRRPVAGDGEVHQGGGEAIASAGRSTRRAGIRAHDANRTKSDSIEADRTRTVSAHVSRLPLGDAGVFQLRRRSSTSSPKIRTGSRSCGKTARAVARV